MRRAQPVSSVAAVKVKRRSFLLSLLTWETLRYAISGSSSTLTYIALTLLLSGPADIPIQIAIPVSYVTALVLNFTLQRRFVFPTDEDLVLTIHLMTAGKMNYAEPAAKRPPRRTSGNG